MFAFLATNTNVDLSPISTVLTESINVGQVAVIVGAVIAGSVALSVFWFGARKLTKAIVVAFQTGKIKF